MRIIAWASVLLFWSCTKPSAPTVFPPSSTIEFEQPTPVQVLGYDDHLMEPFLSRDGETLFFNNENNPAVNTNLHFATRLDDSTFQYRGELTGVNTDALEGVPTMDQDSQFYFVSTRSYDQNFSTIYQGKFSGEAVEDVALVSNISKEQGGWVNFDVEVSKDGRELYFVDGRFDQFGGPYEANIILAIKENGVLKRGERPNILESINTDNLEYAACISANGLELYFTRVATPLSAQSMPQIFVATRDSIDQPFKQPYKIAAISGFVEAPTLAPDDQTLYFHKKENDRFVLYKTHKK